MVYRLSGIRLPSVLVVPKSTGASCFHVDRWASNLPFLPRRSSIPLAASQKILVPGIESEGSSSSLDELKTDDILNDPEAIDDFNRRKKQGDKTSDDDLRYEEPEGKLDDGVDPVPSMSGDAQTPDVSQAPRTVPPPGSGQRIYDIDLLLGSHFWTIQKNV